MALNWRTVPLAPAIAAMFALAAAILVGGTPHWLLERAIVRTGFPHVFGAAHPPLGMKARILAIVVAFVVVGVLAWFLTAYAERRLGARHRTTHEDDVDALDLEPFAEPVTGPRGPIFADRDLGAPLMSQEALERVEPPRPVAVAAEPDALKLSEPKRPALTASEDPLPVAPAQPVPPVRPVPPTGDEPPLHALLHRLETGMARRMPPHPPTPATPLPERFAPTRVETSDVETPAARTPGAPGAGNRDPLQMLRRIAIR